MKLPTEKTVLRGETDNTTKSNKNIIEAIRSQAKRDGHAATKSSKCAE